MPEPDLREISPSSSRPHASIARGALRGANPPSVIAARSVSEAYLTAERFGAAPGRAVKDIHAMIVRSAEGAVRALDLGDTELTAIRLHKSLELIGWLERTLPGNPTPRGETPRTCGNALREARGWLLEAIHYRRREAIVAAIHLLTAPGERWDELLERCSQRSRAIPAPKRGWVG